MLTRRFFSAAIVFLMFSSAASASGGESSCGKKLAKCKVVSLLKNHKGVQKCLMTVKADKTCTRASSKAMRCVTKCSKGKYAPKCRKKCVDSAQAYSAKQKSSKDDSKKSDGSKATANAAMANASTSKPGKASTEDSKSGSSKSGKCTEAVKCSVTVMKGLDKYIACLDSLKGIEKCKTYRKKAKPCAAKCKKLSKKGLGKIRRKGCASECQRIATGQPIFSNSRLASGIFDKIEVSKKRVKAKGDKYSWVNAYAFALASNFAYLSKAEGGSWKAYRKRAIKRWNALGLKYCGAGQATGYSGPVPATKIRDNIKENRSKERKSIDTQYYLVYNDKMMAVVFRGSESDGSFFNDKSKKFKDWIATDARLFPASPWKAIKKEFGRVHRGFYWAYSSVRVEQDLIKRINSCRKLKNPEDPKSGNRSKARPVFFAGHSLGGAVASVAAYDVKTYDKIPVRGVYTYGSPRAFGQVGGRHYDRSLKSVTHRWVNKNDMVTGLPLPGFHRHVGRYHHIHRGAINKFKQYVKLDKKYQIIPRLPAFGLDHTMGKYINLIWEFMPTKQKKKKLGKKYKKFKPKNVLSPQNYDYKF